MKTWDRSNPYEGPEPCCCGHEYGIHWADSDTSGCSQRDCECEKFEMEGT